MHYGRVENHEQVLNAKQVNSRRLCLNFIAIHQLCLLVLLMNEYVIKDKTILVKEEFDLLAGADEQSIH